MYSLDFDANTCAGTMSRVVLMIGAPERRAGMYLMHMQAREDNEDRWR